MLALINWGALAKLPDDFTQVIRVLLDDPQGFHGWCESSRLHNGPDQRGATCCRGRPASAGGWSSRPWANAGGGSIDSESIVWSARFWHLFRLSCRMRPL